MTKRLCIALLVAAGLLVAGRPVEATFTVIDSVSAASSNGTTKPTTAAMDTTAGGGAGATLLVAAISCDGDTSPAMQDSAGNTWVPKTANNATFTGRLQLSYVLSPSTSGTHTFTLVSDVGHCAIAVVALNGNASPTYDQEAAGGGSFGTTVQPGSLTPGADNGVLVTGWLGNAATTTALAIDGIYHPRLEFIAPSGNNMGVGLAVGIQTTAGASNPTWTITGDADSNKAVALSFLDGAGGGGSTVRRRMLLKVGE